MSRSEADDLHQDDRNGDHEDLEEPDSSAGGTARTLNIIILHLGWWHYGTDDRRSCIMLVLVGEVKMPCLL
jgi:hypothetical protein